MYNSSQQTMHMVIDGQDEINCPDSFCPGLQQGCVFPNNPSNLSCISIARAGDGIVDCLGATDERKDCRSPYLTAVVYSWQCLCPLIYYGDTCQYQNERVSLTLQIQVTSDWLNISFFIITLVDHEENIESNDHIEYFPARDCKAKYNLYHLYLTRPKNSSKDYLIRIHVFNKLTLKYRSSWVFPLRFSFLPVYRITTKLTVPFVDNQPLKQCIPPCIHGQCFNNMNDPKSTFCLCESSWSGIQCNIQHTCDCASNSLCFDAFLCICPIGRFGSRCHLLQSSCSSEFCTNRGQCILSDQCYTQSNVNKPMCICSEQYFGDHCEFRMDKEHVRHILLKKLVFGQNSVSFYTEIIFHITIVETFNNYYLIILQEKGVISENISTDINPSHRCLSIHEVFEPIRANQHLLKRIKYYHLPCEQRLDLLCFYDDVHFCLCNLARQANCFQFNHSTTYDCHGHNYCENRGQCFRDDSECPTSSTCGCPDCYFGSRCQFSTKGSTLSLDMILGYYINPNIQLNQQPMIIKIAIALTTIIFIHIFNHIHADYDSLCS